MMNFKLMPSSRIVFLSLLTVTSLGVALLSQPADAQYHQRNLVSDIPGLAELTDANLVNPWGVSSSGSGPFWVSNAGSNTSTLYSVNGTTGNPSINSLVVSTPGPISGQIFNATNDFQIAGGAGRFIFGGLDGNLYAWNPAQGTQAVAAYLGAGTPYTGLGKGRVGNNNFLYGASPATGTIDAFDSSFNRVTLAGNFVDPNLPVGYTPFNVQGIGDQLYVTYLSPLNPGGAVSVFNTDGTFVRRFATDGTLLNPWGMAVAPSDFGDFSNALLVGNFNAGDPTLGAGYINAFDPNTGAFLGLLEDSSGAPVQIDGLWEIVFGNGGNGGVRNQLYFTAGIEGERHGLFGSLQAVPEPGVWALLSGAGLVTLGLRRRRK